MPTLQFVVYSSQNCCKFSFNAPLVYTYKYRLRGLDKKVVLIAIFVGWTLVKVRSKLDCYVVDSAHLTIKNGAYVSSVD
jgi:hypothetical protein